jgi:hypothetical protein
MEENDRWWDEVLDFPPTVDDQVNVARHVQPLSMYAKIKTCYNSKPQLLITLRFLQLHIGQGHRSEIAQGSQDVCDYDTAMFACFLLYSAMKWKNEEW